MRALATERTIKAFPRHAKMSSQLTIHFGSRSNPEQQWLTYCETSKKEITLELPWTDTPLPTNGFNRLCRRMLSQLIVALQINSP